MPGIPSRRVAVSSSRTASKLPAISRRRPQRAPNSSSSASKTSSSPAVAAAASSPALAPASKRLEAGSALGIVRAGVPPASPPGGAAVLGQAESSPGCACGGDDTGRSFLTRPLGASAPLPSSPALPRAAGSRPALPSVGPATARAMGTACAGRIRRCEEEQGSGGTCQTTLAGLVI